MAIEHETIAHELGGLSDDDYAGALEAEGQALAERDAGEKAAKKQDWPAAFDHAKRARDHGWVVWSDIAANGPPEPIIRQALLQLDGSRAEPFFLSKLAQNPVYKQPDRALSPDIVQHMVGLAMYPKTEDARGEYRTAASAFTKHPAYDVGPHEAAAFWNNYESRVDPEHFATMEQHFGGTPAASHRPDRGYAPIDYSAAAPHLEKYAQMARKALINDTGAVYSEPNAPRPQLRSVFGKHYVQVHRGISGDYADVIAKHAGLDEQGNVDRATLKIPVASMSSWSIDPRTASVFAKRTIKGQQTRRGLILTKWMPVDSLMHSGFHDILPSQRHEHVAEGELVFKHPEHYVKVPTSSLRVSQDVPFTAAEEAKHTEGHWREMVVKGNNDAMERLMTLSKESTPAGAAALRFLDEPNIEEQQAWKDANDVFFKGVTRGVGAVQRAGETTPTPAAPVPPRHVPYMNMVRALTANQPHLWTTDAFPDLDAAGAPHQHLVEAHLAKLPHKCEEKAVSVREPTAETKPLRTIEMGKAEDWAPQHLEKMAINKADDSKFFANLEPFEPAKEAKGGEEVTSIQGPRRIPNPYADKGPKATPRTARLVIHGPGVKHEAFKMPLNEAHAYDYSHHLNDEAKDQGYRLTMYHWPGGNNFSTSVPLSQQATSVGNLMHNFLSMTQNGKPVSNAVPNEYSNTGAKNMYSSIKGLTGPDSPYDMANSKLAQNMFVSKGAAFKEHNSLRQSGDLYRVQDDSGLKSRMQGLEVKDPRKKVAPQPQEPGIASQLDVSEGKPLLEVPPHEVRRLPSTTDQHFWDYSHFLPPEKRDQGYRMHMIHTPGSGDNYMRLVLHKNPGEYQEGTSVGEAWGYPSQELASLRGAGSFGIFNKAYQHHRALIRNGQLTAESKPESRFSQLELSEKPVRALFAQTAYRHKKTGKIFPSGPIHDYGAAFSESDLDPELRQLATEGNNLDEYGMVKDPVVEAGFLDHTGKFYNRQEASVAAYGAKRSTGGDSDELRDSGHLKKHEQDDEVDRLLLHPDPAERRMALKLHGVQSKHLVRAFSSDDNELHHAALAHPKLDSQALLALAQMPGRKGLALRSLDHPDITRSHLQALYSSMSEDPREQRRVLNAISKHPALDSKLINELYAAGHATPAMLENLNSPPEVIQHAAKAHLDSPEPTGNIRRLGLSALRHPHATQELATRAIKEGDEGTRLAGIQSPHVPEEILVDVMQRGKLPKTDQEAYLRHAVAIHPRSTERLLDMATEDSHPRVRAAVFQTKSPELKTHHFDRAIKRGEEHPVLMAMQHPGWTAEHTNLLLNHPEPEMRILGKLKANQQPEFKKFEDSLTRWLAASKLEKAVQPIDLAGIVKASDKGGRDLVDHQPHLKSHPPEHAHLVEGYRQHVLGSSDVVKRLSGGMGKDAGITKKIVYQIPAHVPGVGGQKFMIKPYHEKIIQRVKKWQQHLHQGWAEMANQSLYHAAGIGHLHQKVHVAEHNMGSDLPKEPALVVNVEPGWDIVHNWSRFHENPTPEIKADARKVALMDFLTNNLDRHAGNLLYRPEETRGGFDTNGQSVPAEPKSLLAIDHSRSFQYKRPKDNQWATEKEVPRNLEDSFKGYAKAHGIDAVDPLLDRQVDSFHDRQMESLRRYAPTFDWWGEASPKVRASMNKELEQIKDPHVRGHIRRNFESRADWLDERANFGLENYGSNWYDYPVSMYRPHEKTDQEVEAERRRAGAAQFEQEEAQRRMNQ